MRRAILLVTFLMLLDGTAAVAERCVVCNGVTLAAGNILDKLIAMVADYTKRVSEALSMEDVEELFAGFEQALASFSKENADEIAKFDALLTDKAKADYAAELATAIQQFKAALEKRAMEILCE